MDARALFVLIFGTAALLVPVGMALYGSGLSRSKNAAGAMLRGIVSFAAAILAFSIVGAAIMFSRDDRVLWLDPALLLGWNKPLTSSGFLYIVIALIGVGFGVGVLAERSRFAVLALSAVVFAGLVFPIVGHWVWYGFLKRHGFIDVAGAAPLHACGAVCAAVASVLVGPRVGKFNRDGSSNAIPGHSVPLEVAGVLLMLAGWVPYVIAMVAFHALTQDSYMDQAAINVLLAGASGAIASLAYGKFRYGKPEIILTCAGLMGGLVAITASPGSISNLAALCTGAVAGLIVPMAMLQLDVRFRIDDPSGAIAIHGVGGAWALISAGIFAKPFQPRTIAIQAGGLLLAILAAATISLIVFGAARALMDLRSSEADEFDGLDLAEHDINAYPDFQQTMIKSYHLREA